MNNRIYLSGRITGYHGYRAKFRRAETYINSRVFLYRNGYSLPKRYKNFSVVNPTSFTLFGRDLSHYSWTIAMAVCLVKLLPCSYVYMLRNWSRSRGATIEHRLAKALKKDIMYQ